MEMSMCHVKTIIFLPSSDGMAGIVYVDQSALQQRHIPRLRYSFFSFRLLLFLYVPRVVSPRRDTIPRECLAQHLPVVYERQWPPRLFPPAATGIYRGSKDIAHAKAIDVCVGDKNLFAVQLQTAFFFFFYLGFFSFFFRRMKILLQCGMESRCITRPNIFYIIIKNILTDSNLSPTPVDV